MRSSTTSRLAGLTLLVALAGSAGCGRAGGAAESPPPVPQAQDARTGDLGLPFVGAEPAEPLARLDWLRLAGRLQDYVDVAIGAALEAPHDPALQWQLGEALLASGRHDAAEQAAAQAALLAALSDRVLSAQALRLWTVARFRQHKPLDEPRLDALVDQLAAEEGMGLVAFYRQTLAGRQPFRVVSEASSVSRLDSADAKPGTMAFELAAVRARANGAEMDRVFIDTGAQHTLMTNEAARVAGVKLGASSTSLTGFAGLLARPGVLDKLELGGVVIEDVPVLVGNSAPLVANEGQMSLGTDLMHHVRLTIDYPTRRVTAVAARGAPPGPTAPDWEIPLWAFSQICLAEGFLPDESRARVLVDTGNGAGTFVSYRWGRRHLPPLAERNSLVVFRFQKPQLALASLALGTNLLAEWPVTDTLPGELDRLNLVDVIVGRDLLQDYELTIDLARRVLELRESRHHAAAGPVHQNEAP